MAINPAIGAAGISTLGNIAGGILGSSSSKKAAKKAYKYQKEFAQKGLQWKVADAKAAGLHPLFALGASTANFSPAVTAGEYNLGSAVADSARQLGEAYAQSKAPKPGTPAGALGQAALAESQARTRLTQAQTELALSQAARMKDQVNYSQDSATFQGPTTAPGRVPPNRVTPVAPDERSRTTGDPARQSGKNPLFQRYQYGPRKSDWIDVPYSDEGPLDEFGPGKAIGTLIRWLQNRAKSAPLPRRRKRKQTRRGRRYNR